MLGHIVDSRFYRTHAEPGAPEGKYSPKRRGYVVSMGQDLGAVKISGWTHTIPEYFDFDRLWAGYPGAVGQGGVEVTVQGRTATSPALHAHVWGMHHRYPTNSPAIDAEGRGNPAGAHPFKAYNVLLMHNGEQVGVDSTSPFLREFGYVHADESMGEGAALYEGDSVYDRKALTDTEYAAYLVDFTRRVLGLSTEEASQVISPITGLDLEAMDEDRRRLFELLSLNYVQLTPTGPYKFTIVESRPAESADGPADGAGRPAGGAARRLSREHGHQVPAPARARRQRRHRTGRRARGRQRQRGEDRRQHAARAARPGPPQGRRSRPALQHAPGRQPGPGRVRRRGRGLPARRERARSSSSTASASVSRCRAPARRRTWARRRTNPASPPIGATSCGRRWKPWRPSCRPRGHGERPLPRSRRPAAGRRREPRRDRPRAPHDAFGRRLPAPRRGRPARLRSAGRRRPCGGLARPHRAAQAGRLLRPRRQGALGCGVRDRRRASRRRLVRGRHLPAAGRRSAAA